MRAYVMLTVTLAIGAFRNALDVENVCYI